MLRWLTLTILLVTAAAGSRLAAETTATPKPTDFRAFTWSPVPEGFGAEARG